MSDEPVGAELVATYSALGTRDGDEYFRGEECLACVKDLIRALRGDNDQCKIRRHLGKARVLQMDLMPLLVHYADDVRLRNDVIRLLVNLTQPAYLSLGERYPGGRDTGGMKCLIEVNKYLREYKEEFAAERVMNTLGVVLAELCQKNWDDRDDDDVIIIERILLLIRNVLHVPPAPEEEKRTDDDVSLHDQIIWNVHINGIDELLLFLGSNPNETEWCMHVMEIVFLLLRQQSPVNLAQAGRSRTHEEKRRDEDKIEELLLREKSQHNKKSLQRGTRHSNFGGSFVVTNQMTVSGKGRVHHKPLSVVNSYSQDVEKRPRRIPKNKRMPAEPPKERLSTFSIRLVLKEFCVQLLECCFNVLMRVVMDNIKRMKAMDNDETYYLWSMRFFMEFSRLNNFRVDIVSETLQLTTLHYVLQLMVSYYENMVMHKRERQDALAWSQRLHYAVQAYKELLLYIQTMTRSHDHSIVESSKVILSNILYHAEYRDIFVTLLRNHYEAFQPMGFINDVIEMTHTYMSLLEYFCKTNGRLVVQKRRKVGRKKKKKGQEDSTEVWTEEQLVAKWEEVKEEVEGMIAGAEFLGELPVPFDALSDRTFEEQKRTAMTTVCRKLCSGQHQEAIAWMRASREMWPDDVFGFEDMSPSEELDTLRELLLNPLSNVRALHQEPRPEIEEGMEDGEEDRDPEDLFRSYELEFDMKKYTELFTNNKIVRVYTLALSSYRSNSDHLNHAIVKMLHRVAVAHNMAPMLYQISVFRTFSKVLSEPPLPRYKELQKFCSHIVAGFFRLTHSNPLLFAELLVWKTSRDCYELTKGYGTLERERERFKNRTRWTREQEEELRTLYEEYKNDGDVVGCIEAALPKDHCRTRKIIASQLVSIGLVESRQSLSKKKKGEWSEEELFTLQSVFQYQEDENEAVKQVSQYFPGRGIPDIRRQLQTMGLITATRGSRRKNRAARSLDDDGDPDSSVDSQEMMEEGEWPDPSLTHSRTSRQSTHATVRNVRRLVRLLHKDGFTEQLSWLEMYISDEAQDREADDEWEEMCVVAMERQITEALDRQDFKDLMASIGLSPPTAQEVYWRIPASMSPAKLREVAASLRHMGDDESEEEDEVEEEGRKDHISNTGADTGNDFNVKNVRRLVGSLHRAGLTEQLSWLEMYIRDEAQDREADDEWEEMCVVAMERQVVEALDRQDFKNVMGLIGLTPPTTQEVYWRIPASMSPAKLREIATSLQCQEDENEDMMEEEREEYSQFMEEKAAKMHSAKRSKRRMEDSSDGDEDHPRLTIVTSLRQDDHMSEQDHSNDYYSDQQVDDYSSGKELNKADALAALRKKRKRMKKQATDASPSQSPSPPPPPPPPSAKRKQSVPKKPRLATRSQFLSDQSDDDSQMEDDLPSSLEAKRSMDDDIGARHSRKARLESDSDYDEDGDSCGGLQQLVDGGLTGGGNGQEGSNAVQESDPAVREEEMESSFHLGVTETMNTETSA